MLTMGGSSSKVLLPFTVGHHSPSLEGHVKNTQDASISAVIFAILLLACCMTLSVARWLTVNQTEPVGEPVVKLFLSLLMLTGCLVIVASWKFLHRCTVSRQRRLTSNISMWTTRDFFLTRLSFIGLMVFFLCGIVLDAFPLYAELQCLKPLAICGIIFPHLLDVLFYTCRFAFKCLVVIFSFRFEDRHLARCPPIRYCLLAIALPVICNWIDGLVNEAAEQTSLSQMKIQLCKIKLNASVSNGEYSTDNGTFWDHCIEGKSPAHILALHAHTILYPFDVEFSMMALKILLQIYCCLKWPSFSIGDTRQNGTSNEDTDEQENGRHSNERTESFQVESLIILPYSDADQNSIDHTGHPVTEDEDGAVINEEQSLIEAENHEVPNSFPMIVFLVVLVNVAMFVVVAETFFGAHQSVYKYCLLVYWIPLVLASLQGLRVINDQFVSDFSGYTGLEVLVVVSMLGAFCQLFFQFFATISCLMGTHIITNATQIQSCNEEYDAKLLWVSAVGFVVNFVQMILQVTFMAYASKVKVRNRPDRAVWWLRQCALYTAIANLILWLIDSFDQAKNIKIHPAQTYFYGDAWVFISYLTVPFFLFFRFNSFMIFLKIYLKLAY